MASKSKQYYDKNPDAKKKKAAYDKAYNAREDQKKNRASRNSARRKMKSAGKVRSGQDVNHRNGNPRDNRMSNLNAESKSKNRGRK